MSNIYLSIQTIKFLSIYSSVRTPVVSDRISPSDPLQSWQVLQVLACFLQDCSTSIEQSNQYVMSKVPTEFTTPIRGTQSIPIEALRALYLPCENFLNYTAEFPFLGLDSMSSENDVWEIEGFNSSTEIEFHTDIVSRGLCVSCAQYMSCKFSFCISCALLLRSC